MFPYLTKYASWFQPDTRCDTSLKTGRAGACSEARTYIGSCPSAEGRICFLEGQRGGHKLNSHIIGIMAERHTSISQYSSRAY